MTSFAISEDGQLYSALTSSNTCALVDVGVSQGKAAWEFLLEEDSPRYACYFGEHTASAGPYRLVFEHQSAPSLHRCSVPTSRGTRDRIINSSTSETMPSLP